VAGAAMALLLPKAPPRMVPVPEQVTEGEGVQAIVAAEA
jgi:hypothetical protein